MPIPEVRLFIVCSICLLLFGFRIPDLIEAPLEPPFIELPEKRVEKEKIEHLEREESKTAREEYRLGRLYILARDLTQAKMHLSQALEMKAEFEEAELQMGFLFFWENNLEGATKFFEEVLKQHSCDKQALYGLSQVAKKLPDPEAIPVLEKLLECDRKNPDFLFYLGQRYERVGEREKAKQAYQQALEASPGYPDVAVALARIYGQERNKAKLKELAQQHRSNAEVQKTYYQALATPLDYGGATQFTDRLPPNGRLRMQDPEINAVENISASLEATYTDAKESDPSIGQPVVKDYYFYSALNIFIPICDKWRVDLKPFLYHQRENDIYPPVGVNYNVYESGGQATSHYYFASGWRWDVVARGFASWGEGQEIFPFQNTSRFEPGTSLLYNTEHLFVLDLHVESFIIKNFSDEQSQLLRTDYGQVIYGYRPNVSRHPKMEASATWVRYHDSLHNWKNKETALFGVDLYSPSLTTFYLFEHAGFNHLNPNYFSYKQQYRNTIEVKYHRDFSKGAYFETFWDHTWEMTHDLFLPIGDFIFVASQLYLIWNTLTTQVGYQYKQCKIELGGHYLHNTLPYTDWNVRGSLLYQF